MWGMILSLSSHDYNQLQIWAKLAYPMECCGLIWAEKDRKSHISRLELTKNTASNPLKYFEIDPKSLFDANRITRTSHDIMIGIFHSHPNGLETPSQKDAADVNIMGQIWMIIAKDSVKAWISAENGELHNIFNPIVINIIN